MASPHGVPLDLLDRTLIVRTMPYSVEEIVQIMSIRAVTEGFTLSEGALSMLGELGDRTSLRYAMQLITPAMILAKTCERDTINAEDIEEVDSLFLDAKQSAKLLSEQDGFLL